YSQDLVTWERNDELAGITTSDTGWDSEMVCYPHLKVIDDDFYLFYCGNNFGQDGFGLAKMIID
ncbi:MAG: hypothetical protein JJ909_16770, partial [Roseivirga sp.]|nr:hypothetical protein [Roseivirga sp.]